VRRSRFGTMRNRHTASRQIEAVALIYGTSRVGHDHHRRMVHRLRFVPGIAGVVRFQPEFLANVGILLGVERSPVLGEQA
jgi:hypothetical protein